VRILHTADWHLGKVLFQRPLTADQRELLDQVVALARERRPDVVIIAGDLYDRAIPPPEAVTALDGLLTELVDGVGVPVLAVSGNHDHPMRLQFASRMLARRGLHVRGDLAQVTEPVRIADAHGPVEFTLVPYADPPTVRAFLGRTDLDTHDAAMRALLGRVRESWRAEDRLRRVLVGHAFVAGASESKDSERPLSLGGTGFVGADAYAGFDYVALGHLHAPQTLSGGRVRYSGSPMRYAHSECGRAPGVSMVEIDAQGTVAIEHVPLVPRRDLRVVEGTLAELLAAAPGDPRPEDFILARYTDEEYRHDPAGQLRAYYPNLMHVERLARATRMASGAARPDRRRLDDVELFAAFHEYAVGKALAPDDLREIQATVSAMASRP
jgi:exonuclease SbcD